MEFLVAEMGQWMRTHYILAALVIFLLMLLESLLLIGWFIPAVTLLIMAGGLIALDALQPVPVTDGSPEWGLHRGQHELLVRPHLPRGPDQRLWPFSRRPGPDQPWPPVLPPLRQPQPVHRPLHQAPAPLMPAVAGMVRMPPRRFLLANLLSIGLMGPRLSAAGFHGGERRCPCCPSPCVGPVVWGGLIVILLAASLELAPASPGSQRLNGNQFLGFHFGFQFELPRVELRSMFTTRPLISVTMRMKRLLPKS
jgi:hypothetical protein